MSSGRAHPRQAVADSAKRAAQKPVILVADHDRRSLEVLVSDLKRRFGRDFDVRGMASRETALAALEAMAAASHPVGLVLVSEDLCDLLDDVRNLHPRTKRVLLVDRDYSSTSPAVQAMTLGRADYHITRPWMDDEAMYRAVSGYLSAWGRDRAHKFELFRLVAPEGDARSESIRDVLARFSTPVAFYATDSAAGQRLLTEAGVETTRLPVLIRHDGRVMIDPSLPDLARAIGVNVENDIDTCEVAIVGAGPAGLTAALYAASEGLETALLELAVSGGQAGQSPLIRNYPGFPHGINGGALMERTCEQAWLMGAHIVFAQRAVGLTRSGCERTVHLADGTQVRAHAVVIATGMKWRRLGVPSIESRVGAGVFYGAAVGESRAMLNQDVFIVGGGNSAGQAALHLARYARTVTLLVRGTSLTTSMSTYLVRAIESTANVSVRLNTEVTAGHGDGRLESLTLADHASATVEEVAAAAVFLMIGGEPNTQWLPREIARVPDGYLLTGRDLLEQPGVDWPCEREPLTLETSMPGVFAAGDVREGSINRVASAVGEGATVVRLLHEYLRDHVGENTTNGGSP